MTNLTREEILEERKYWYSQRFIQFELIKCLNHRELCFLTLKSEEKKKAVRYMIAFSVDYLLKHLKWFNVEGSLINMYHSVAVLKDVPVFSYDLKMRKQDPKYQEFDQNYEKYVTGYNFFFDCDGKENFELCFQEAKELKKILEEFKVPYYLLNSSRKGFHFVIEAKYMPEKDIHKSLELLNEILYNIIGIYNFKTIDPSIIDLKRVQKVPYSYECSGVICLPLTDAQFEFFKPENVEMKQVLKDIHIKERGVLTRTYGLDEQTLKENVSKFIKDFS